ncbi:MAG: hypothetical protein HOQ22_15625 [Nocardioidaceae bacterium]|nr:hypothetical protein [Nocardioidaceae bacterium]NUS52455.1 hypothetical protein [Nocardioidaceae bacterium]
MPERTRAVVARLHARTARARIGRLERELDEARRLNRRVAELTDLVTELLVPLARRDDAEVDAVLARYRSLV